MFDVDIIAEMVSTLSVLKDVELTDKSAAGKCKVTSYYSQ
jgi:hypothetical protein